MEFVIEDTITVVLKQSFYVRFFDFRAFYVRNPFYQFIIKVVASMNLAAK